MEMKSLILEASTFLQVKMIPVLELIVKCMFLQVKEISL